MGYFEETAQQLIEKGYDRRDVIAVGGSNCCDMLSLEECDAIAQAYLQVADPDDRARLEEHFNFLKSPDDPKDEKALEEALGNWKFVCARNWRKLRSEELLKKHAQTLAFPGFEARVTQDGHCLLVEAKESESEAIAQYYNLHYGEPAYMRDLLSSRRIDDETLLALFGDDRDYSYWALLAFAPIEICEAFYPKTPEYGAFG